jgi:CRP-like cAMP-binding protein
MNGVERRYRNSILNALSVDIVQRLELVPVIFERQSEIEVPGVSIKRLYFIEDGLASMTTTFKDGSQVDLCIYGYDSVVGFPALMGIERSPYRVSTQIAGSGYSCAIQNARAEFSRGEAFQRLILRSVQAQLITAAQSAGCNARHRIDQRLARWLLACSDRTGYRDFRLSHTFLADMLGSTRPTVSLVANTLRTMGLIQYRRGLLTIVDVSGLETMSCECYRVIRNHMGNHSELNGRAEP